MAETFLSLETADGPMDAFLAQPPGSPKAGLVVVQEAFGLNGYIKDVCRRLAGEGYAALAPDFYHRLGRGVVVDYSEVPKAVGLLGSLSNEGLLADFSAGMEALRPRVGAGPCRMGTVGFCVGGFASFLAACRFELGAAVCFYPGGLVRERPGLALKPPLPLASGIRGAVLGLYGGEDPSIPPEDVEAVRAELARLGIRHETIIYPGARHGFFCGQRAAYHPASSEDAWRRVKDFLSENLG